MFSFSICTVDKQYFLLYRDTVKIDISRLLRVSLKVQSERSQMHGGHEGSPEVTAMHMRIWETLPGLVIQIDPQ